MTGADDTALHISWFSAAILNGQPALGDPEMISWSSFCGVFEWRREGEKDGCCFSPARFELEADGRQVRRVARNVLARTAIALDVEAHKDTGKVPPALSIAMQRAAAFSWACLGYTSHSHAPDNDRYRLVFPLSAEIDPGLPAVDVVADALDLAGVLDRSKLNAVSVFYLPSCPYDGLEHHQTAVIPGTAIDAAWMTQRAGALLEARQAEAERIVAEAHDEAAARRAATLAAGFDPDDSLIEKLRSHLDLTDVLIRHGYDRAGTKFRHPNSQSGGFGADIKTFGGIDRVFSHNAGDPLHASNLPDWCGVTAVDAVDATIILDYLGDRTRGLRNWPSGSACPRPRNGRILPRCCSG